MNAATMENSGLEFLLAYHNHQHAVKYDISANLSTLNNKVTKLGVLNQPRTDGICRTEVGREVGSFYGYVSEGIFQSQQEIDNNVNANGDLVTQNGGMQKWVTLNTPTSTTTAQLTPMTEHTWVVVCQRLITA